MARKTMVSEGVYLKKIDRKMYRKLKAMAAERDLPVYKLLNEAIARYVASSSRGPMQESDEEVVSFEQADNAAYREAEIDPSLRGKWVGIAKGAVVAKGDDPEVVIDRMREIYSKSMFPHGVVARVGGVNEEREWLAGSLRQA